jgi:glycosyltransferase involved in cell wall biosynthesis
VKIVNKETRLISPQISVIMSAYNCQRFLKEAVEIILQQTFTDFEFIITDDGSTDELPSILRSYADTGDMA